MLSTKSFTKIAGDSQLVKIIGLISSVTVQSDLNCAHSKILSTPLSPFQCNGAYGRQSPPEYAG